MKRLAALAVLLTSPAMAARTSEVLVTTAGVALPALNGRLGIEVFNYGPNPLHCVFGSSITGNTFWIIPALSGTSPGYWTSAARAHHAITCSAVTADQLTGAATIVNELD
jgi:hypothetical protein